MKTFKGLMEEMSAADAAKKKLKNMKGQQVSFTHQSSGEKITGEYKGMKSMGGRSYAHIETGKGAHRVPPHHVHQTQNESVEKIDEISKKTMSSYVKKAGPGVLGMGASIGMAAAQGKKADADTLRQSRNRQKGIARAVDKLAK